MLWTIYSKSVINILKGSLAEFDFDGIQDPQLGSLACISA